VKAVIRWISRLLDGPGDAAGVSFRTWQQRLIQKRLTLSVAIALSYFSSFTVISGFRLHWQGQSLDLRTTTNLMTAISLGGLMVWLHTPMGRRHPMVTFLGLSWAITILTNVSQTITGIIVPDLKGWIMTFFAQATIMPFRWQWHLVSQLGAYAYYLGVNGLVFRHPIFPPGVVAGDLLFDMAWNSALPTLAVYLYERLSQAEFETKQKLRAEQQRSRQLLLNVLPESIAERLLQEPTVIADHFAEVTVLFADIVGFTQLSTQKSPDEIVQLLNEVFSRFDELAEQYGLEKIKTIGDAYMVVAGIPYQRPDHAAAIADMALAMRSTLQAYNQRTGQTLAIRTGIHSGPVIAGVIGLKKFAYDLWGDTVNTASRMESHGLPDEIQLTQSTYEHLKHHYHFQVRGAVEIKGKGSMTTYLLLKATQDPVGEM
jgi:adenylate cyclase